MNALDAFRIAAQERSISDDVIEWWLQQARPCLDLNRDSTDPLVGYFGGRPALPAGITWPDGSVHLASVDLTAIPHGTLDLNLPDAGTLLFFAERDYCPMAGHVIYVPAGTPVEEAAPPADCPVYDRISLHADPYLCLPESYETSHADRYDYEILDEICDIMWDLEFETEGTGTNVVTLGGYGSSNTGGLGVPVESFETNALLAEFFLCESEVGKDFQSDLITVFYVASRDDLTAGRFDRVRVLSDFHG